MFEPDFYSFFVCASIALAHLSHCASDIGPLVHQRPSHPFHPPSHAQNALVVFISISLTQPNIAISPPHYLLPIRNLTQRPFHLFLGLGGAPEIARRVFLTGPAVATCLMCASLILSAVLVGLVLLSLCLGFDGCFCARRGKVCWRGCVGGSV